MEHETIELTEKQQQRVAAFKGALETVLKDIDGLKKQENALRLGVESVLATVLECQGVNGEARYQLSEDGTALTMVKEGTNGLAQPN